MRVLTDVRVDDLQTPADLGSGYRLEPAGSAIDLESWRAYIGEHEIESMHEANAWIWVEGSSGANRREKVGYFETALLLTRAPRIFESWMLEGPIENGAPRVSSFGRREQRTIKEPPYPLTTVALEEAAALADVLARTFEAKTLVGRLDRGFVSLVLAMSATYVEDSVLYLMRALEGMLSADNSREFKARAGAVLRGGRPDLLEELYRLRNKFTHAEPVNKAFPAGMTEEQMAERCRRLQAFLYHFATRSYREVLGKPEVMRLLTGDHVRTHWDRVLRRDDAPPFVVAVEDDLWDFEHDSTHYLMRPDAVRGYRLPT
jgi:hypothetical protein